MRTATCVLVLGLLLASCGGTAGESAASRAATQMPSQPSPSNAATPVATAFGAAIFPDPDDCRNEDVGYRVAYPDSWYSNASEKGISACWLFAPMDFAVMSGTEIPAAVGIVMRRYEEWDPGSFSGRRVLSDDPAVVDGLPARVQEVEITERTLAFAPGDRVTEYVIELPDGADLVATTYLSPDYESARRVLRDMMRSLQIRRP